MTLLWAVQEKVEILRIFLLLSCTVQSMLDVAQPQSSMQGAPRSGLAQWKGLAQSTARCCSAHIAAPAIIA